MSEADGPSEEIWRSPDVSADRVLARALGETGSGLEAGAIGIAGAVYPAPLRARDPGAFVDLPWFGVRARKPVYPASVVKLFYLYACCAFAADGDFVFSDEDRRAARAMIGVSSNEATAYLLGRLTGAYDGPGLEGEARTKWWRKRRKVHDWLMAMGRPEFEGIRVYHATYEDSPYGVAYQVRAPENQNRLTPLASAALIHDIARGALPGSDYMMELLARDEQRRSDPDCEGDQVRGFLADGLPASVRIWSKGGHTSWTRHDCLYGECADGRSFVLSVMGDGVTASRDRAFLPAIARAFWREAFGEAKRIPRGANPHSRKDQRDE